MEKRCSRCETTKPVSEFGSDRNRSDGRYPQCKSCQHLSRRESRARHPEAQLAYREAHAEEIDARMKAWRAANIERLREADRKNYWATREAHRDSRRKRLYGLTGAQYAAMVESQKGLCAICNEPPSERGLFIDHCHQTNVVRGLLCGECNIAIGKMVDSPARLRAAAMYLEERVNGVLPKGTE